MSGLAAPGNSIKSGIFRRVRPRLFASVHGVSVVILWSALHALWREGFARGIVIGLPGAEAAR